MDGRVDGWTDGSVVWLIMAGLCWTDGRADGWAEGQ